MFIVRSKKDQLQHAVKRLDGETQPRGTGWFQIGTATLELDASQIDRFGLRRSLERLARAFMQQENRGKDRKQNTIAIHIHGVEIHREFGPKETKIGRADTTRKRKRP